MRGKFFLYLVVGLICLAIAYFFFMVLRAIYLTIMDVVNARDLDKLATEFAEKRDEQQREAAARLENGCQHEFDDAGGALPANVCRKCGITKSIPAGDCDHVWQVLPGIIPSSSCKKCGENFSSVPNT